MKCLSIRAFAFLFVSSLLIFPATAARLRTSTLVVQVLSVDQESYDRYPPLTSQSRPVGEQVIETTGFVAKVQIQTVIVSDYDLAPGETITIHYKIRTGTPLPLTLNDKPLKPGETVRLEVMKAADGYERR